jgi:hypothetical protein
MVQRAIFAMFALSLLATACSGGGSDNAVTPQVTEQVSVEDVSSVDADGVDHCGQGGAFPDDPDFREAICLPVLAMTSILGSGVEMDPEWGSRVTAAILNYANRDDAMAELAAVLVEIRAAG